VWLGLFGMVENVRLQNAPNMKGQMNLIKQSGKIRIVTILVVKKIAKNGTQPRQ
jgi:hypothetical protein